jgi:hypothetical protein
MSTDQQQQAIQSIGNVSTLLRQAIGAAIPVSPDQYLTISIPGTVIDTTEVSTGGSFVYDASKFITAPLVVQQAEAKLVDGMMPLANIMASIRRMGNTTCLTLTSPQIGNTGKSVSRSYSRALDALVPRKATISTGSEIRSPGEAMYDEAMKYLTTPNPDTGLTPVEIYAEKQSKWASAQEKWDRARMDAKSQSPF